MDCCQQPPNQYSFKYSWGQASCTSLWAEEWCQPEVLCDRNSWTRASECAWGHERLWPFSPRSRLRLYQPLYTPQGNESLPSIHPSLATSLQNRFRSRPFKHPNVFFFLHLLKKTREREPLGIASQRFFE